MCYASPFVDPRTRLANNSKKLSNYFNINYRKDRFKRHIPVTRSFYDSKRKMINYAKTYGIPGRVLIKKWKGNRVMVDITREGRIRQRRWRV